MKLRASIFTLTVAAGLLAAVANLTAAETEPPIDVQRGKALMEKSSRGESLTAEEQAYLDRVKKAIRERSAGKQPSGPTKGSPSRPIEK